MLLTPAPVAHYGKGYRPQSIFVNGVLAQHFAPGCRGTVIPLGSGCIAATVQFEGSSSLRRNREATLTSPDPTTAASAPGWFNSTVDLDLALKQQRTRIQQWYPVPWLKRDLTATWLGNRRLLYIFVTQPDVNYTRPRMWLNGSEVRQSFSLALPFLHFSRDAKPIEWWLPLKPLENSQNECAVPQLIMTSGPDCRRPWNLPTTREETSIHPTLRSASWDFMLMLATLYVQRPSHTPDPRHCTSCCSKMDGYWGEFKVLGRHLRLFPSVGGLCNHLR